MAKQSYRVLQTQLDEIMEKIQSEDLDVEAAIALYKQGQELIVQLETYLKSAENSVKKLKLPE